MKPRGIPIAQVRSDTEGDDKVRLLRELAPDRMTYLAAFGAYMSFVLQSWNKADRLIPATAKRLIPKELLDLLIECELLDASGDIPESSFGNYAGEYLRYREERAEQLAAVSSKGGRARASGPRDERGRLVSPAVTAGEPADTGWTSSRSPAVPPVLSSAGTSSSVEGVQGESGGWAYLYPVAVELTGKHVPHGKFASDLCELAEQAGPDVVVAAMRAVADAMAPVRPDIRALAFGASNAIRQPPSGRTVATVVQDEQERAYNARKAAERAQARLDRQKRALELAGELADAEA